MFLISIYGRRDLGFCNLVNLSDGGEFNSGRVLSKEHKEAISKRFKGKKQVKTEARIEASKNRAIKMTGKKMPKSHSENVSKALKGRIFSNEWKERISNSRKGSLNSMSKKVINTETMEVWGSYSECADENNINRSTFRSWMNGSKKNNSKFKPFKDE